MGDEFDVIVALSNYMDIYKVTPNQTLKELKENVLLKVKLKPPEVEKIRQLFVKDGLIMEDEKTLSSYNISHGTILHLFSFYIPSKEELEEEEKRQGQEAAQSRNEGISLMEHVVGDMVRDGGLNIFSTLNNMGVTSTAPLSIFMQRLWTPTEERRNLGNSIITTQILDTTQEAPPSGANDGVTDNLTSVPADVTVSIDASGVEGDESRSPGDSSSNDIISTLRTVLNSSINRFINQVSQPAGSREGESEDGIYDQSDRAQGNIERANELLASIGVLAGLPNLSAPGIPIPQGVASRGTASRSNLNPSERYQEELHLLEEMGFYNTTSNIQALQLAGGVVESAIEILLGNPITDL